MMKLGRDKLLDQLERDLIGPQGGEFESIVARPGDQYLTGILFPISPPAEVDEQAAEADDDADVADDSDGSPGEAIPTAAQRRQTAMGLTFSIAGSAPAIKVRVSAARYAPRWVKDGKVFEKAVDGAAQNWVREPFSKELDVTVEEGLAKPRAVVEGLALHVKALKGATAWQTTVVITNSFKPEPGREPAERHTFFQVELAVSATGKSKLVARPAIIARTDTDDDLNALLYRHAKEWAVGHTCAASWNDDEAPTELRTEWVPRHVVPSMDADGFAGFHVEAKKVGGDGPGTFDADTLASATAERLVELLQVVPRVYGRWLAAQGLRVTEGKELTANEAERAAEQLELAREAENRIATGIDVLRTDPVARKAFQLAQKCMAVQRRWATDADERLIWRPFQIGFQLLTLDGIARPRTDKGAISRDRRLMDLLWFPTGGGKTEAYLAITAFTLFLRRLRRAKPDDGAGVAVIMRYTLRLLTTQQFERAAALILACEVERWADPALGVVPFSIGLWVGSGATPNRIKDARQPGAAKKAMQLTRCPACRRESLAWDTHPHADEFLVECRGVANTRGRAKNPSASETAACPFEGRVLPVWTIDEEVYRRRPSLVIGTVDKFAQITRKSETHALFGNPEPPPELIIQDELHLISGPLGTIAGLYEIAVEILCTDERGVPPKILGSTATIRRATEQVKHLFGREVFQFPPPIIDADDSCFSVVNRSLPGRLYAGITTIGRSPKFALQATCASLMQGASEKILGDDERDPYWTLMTYFNSLRELGGALVMMLDDVPDSVLMFAGLHKEKARAADDEPMELTSRIDSADIPQYLAQLGVTFAQGQERAVVLATNMISVGMDIPRLGLMVVNGQPKGMAEYIQATSRVGRGTTPGLIVTVYNAGRPRDRSHYEAFRTWHSTLYRSVEATSVTPFAPRARDRALHAAIVALARHRIAGLLDDPATLSDSHAAQLDSIVDAIVQRARDIDPQEEDGTRDDASAFVEFWRNRGTIKHFWRDIVDGKAGQPLLLSAEAAARLKALERDGRLVARATLNSMREVEPSVSLRMVSKLTTPKVDGAGGNS